MGAVSSRVEDGPAVFLKDQSRFTIASLQITNAKRKVLLNIAPNAFPSTRATVKRELGDESLVEYVQDPDAQSLGSGLLLKVTNEDELYFNFTFNVRQRIDETNNVPIDTNIAGLTFIFAQNHQEIDNLVTREFHADPNLHKNPSVSLVGDYSTEGNASISFTWTWKWIKPQDGNEKHSGFRNTLSFVEYDQRGHRLVMLAKFSIWVQNNIKQFLPLPSPGLYGGFEQKVLPKQRVSSYNFSDSSPVEGGDYTNEAFISGPDQNIELPVPPNITSTPIKVDVNCHRPTEEYTGDDGPLFRATMKDLESRTFALRQKMKKVLKKAEQAKQAQSLSNDAMKEFIEALREASGSALGIKPAVVHYFDRAAKEIYRYERQNEVDLQKFVIEPMNRIYNLDIKQAEAKKKDFDEESRDYYSFVSRYLGKRQDSSSARKQEQNDTKYQAKRRNFEIKRFDYGSFMQDLHGGRKEQEVLSHLTKYADAQMTAYLRTAQKIQEDKAHLDALSLEVNKLDKEYKLMRTEREERRRGLEMNAPTFDASEAFPNLLSPGATASSTLSYITSADLHATLEKPEQPATIRAISSNNAPINPSESSLAQSSTSYGSSAPILSPNPNPNVTSNKFKGIRDLEEKDYTQMNGIDGDRRKEGLLWALSRPGSHVDPKGLNKQAWHKYWVVLAGGQLCEYSNWKQKLDLHNDPINLRMASAREARSSERRFCFEVITPQYKRVYQGTSEEDMNNWINAINNAVKGTLEGGRSSTAFDTSKLEEDAMRKDISSVFTGGRAPSVSHHYHIPHAHHHNQQNQQTQSQGAAASSSLHRRITVGAKPLYTRRSSYFSDDPEKLLQLVRDSDAGNSSCADCNSQIKTEWVSINLGIVLCIECSGIHRSLGTHISKIRSLTLDVTSFTPDLTELLLRIGNTLANSIWEARLDPSMKPNAQSSRETRLKYISAKYVDRLFVRPLSTTLSEYGTPQETLLAGVKSNDLAMVLHALALKADANALDPSTGTHLIFKALNAADPPTSPSKAISTPDTSPNSKATTKQCTFPIAELFFQNGGQVEAMSAPILSASATNYLVAKTARQGTGIGTVPKPSMLVDASRMNDPLDRREKERREKEEKLRKRLSTHGRPGKPIS